MRMYGHLFKNVAKQYKATRPRVPSVVFDKILDYCKKDNTHFKRDLAVDVGCGSGQSTIPLADHFHKVIGVDISKEQIERAPKCNRKIKFVIGDARQLSFLDDDTVDLATCAVSLHWFEGNEFYNEIKRVLRPGGVLAAYSYHYPRIYPELANLAVEKVEVISAVARIRNVHSFVVKALY